MLPFEFVVEIFRHVGPWRFHSRIQRSCSTLCGLNSMRSGGGAPLSLVDPSMYALDVAASDAAVAESIHCRERVLTFPAPHIVAKLFGAFVECAFVFCH